MSAPETSHVRLQRMAPEQARDARARAWAYVFRRHEMKKATRPGSPDDGEESKNASTATPQYNR